MEGKMECPTFELVERLRALAEWLVHHAAMPKEAEDVDDAADLIGNLDHEVTVFMQTCLDMAQKIHELEAENARLREAASYVHNAFLRDKEQGYRTRDKTFAMSILGKALGDE
jgi:hypothetical protein